MKKIIPIFTSLILAMFLQTNSYADTSSCEVSVIVVEKSANASDETEDSTFLDEEEIKDEDEKLPDVYIINPPAIDDDVFFEEDDTETEEDNTAIIESSDDNGVDNGQVEEKSEITEVPSLDGDFVDIPSDEFPTSFTFEDIIRKLIWVFYKGSSGEYKVPSDIPDKLVKSIFYYSVAAIILLIVILALVVTREIRRRLRRRAYYG